MAVQPTPPIQIDPSTDDGHKWAFVNQNFQNIANVIQQNSFVIVSSGTLTIPLATLAAAGSTNTYFAASGSPDVYHNLGYTPVVLAFAQNAADEYTLMPLLYHNTGGTGGGLSIATYTVTATNSIVTGYCNFVAYGGYNFTGTSTPAINVKYFLLQQTASS